MSGDFIATLNHWAKELNASFPLLSDYRRKVMEQYGVLNAQSFLANRVTFIIDKEGKVVETFENAQAIDPTGAETACRRVKQKSN